MGLKPADVMTTVLEAFGRQIFCTGFLHSDPHPANLLVRKMANGAHQVVVSFHFSFSVVARPSMIKSSVADRSRIVHDP